MPRVVSQKYCQKSNLFYKMISETLAEKLKYSRAYRKTRLDVAQWVIEHPETFPEYSFSEHRLYSPEQHL